MFPDWGGWLGCKAIGGNTWVQNTMLRGCCDAVSMNARFVVTRSGNEVMRGVIASYRCVRTTSGGLLLALCGTSLSLPVAGRYAQRVIRNEH